MAPRKQPIIGMSHLGICVRDMETALAFYRDLIGMQVQFDQYENPDIAKADPKYAKKR